jgi:hypothetical protein
MTHSQARLVNSVQPSRRSASMCDGSRAGSGTRTRRKHSAATRNVNASTAIPQPGLATATRPPAAEPPTIIAKLRVIRDAALAARNSSAGTVCGVTALDAGTKTAAAAPLTALNTTSNDTDAVPVSTSEATSAWDTPAPMLDPWSSNARGSRSANTPPASSSTTLATDRAATTRPRSAAEPVRSSTAKASAIGAIPLPRKLTDRPAVSQQKSRWRNKSANTGRASQPLPEARERFSQPREKTAVIAPLTALSATDSGTEAIPSSPVTPLAPGLFPRRCLTRAAPRHAAAGRQTPGEHLNRCPSIFYRQE